MTATLQQRSTRILHVEDNPGDARLAEEAFDEVEANVDLTVVQDGARALAVLRAAEKGETARPDLVLLDLNLPTKSGVEVLEEIKSDKSLRKIPVIILTTTDDDATIDALYDNHANAFVTKPTTVDQFIEMIESVNAFWLSSATLPQQTVNR